ncbi:Nn.00g022040.m01.CDS01 [Neocucurbitaria sp. VM-36]
MVDQNSNSPVQNTYKPQRSGTPANQDAPTQPTVVKAGETMLIISLVLISMVACTVSLHLFLRRRKRQRKVKDRGTTRKVSDTNEKKRARGKKAADDEQPELHSQEKEMAELAGTPLCEMGESEPRHEMEGMEVTGQYAQPDSSMQPYSETSSHLKSERWSVSDGETARQLDADAGISWYDAAEERVPEPDERELAMYWSRGM